MMIHWNNDEDASQRKPKDGICSQVPTKMWKLMRHLEFQKYTEKLHFYLMKDSWSSQTLVFVFHLQQYET